MSTYGRNVSSLVAGFPLQVLADFEDVDWKSGGITVDWSTVAAVSGTDVTLNNGDVIPVGAKYLRYGAVLTKITASGKYGPYDPAAADGRQTLARGAAWVLNETVREHGAQGFDISASDHPAVFDGGRVYKARVLMTTGTHSLAAGPTVTEFETVFPDIDYAEF